MQRIIIEAPRSKELTYLIKLLKRLDFIRSVELETNVIEENPEEAYVKSGSQMSLKEFVDRIRAAEAEDEEGLSIPDEELNIDF